MHIDDFSSLTGGFDHFDGCYGQPAYDVHAFDGYLDDAHTQSVDPYAESFNLATADPVAIGMRLQREHEAQVAAQSFTALNEGPLVAAESWVRRVVLNVGQEDEFHAPAVSDQVWKWQVAERLSMALAKALGYELDDRDEDSWYRPSDREWRHMPTDSINAYNAAYTRFCALIGKRLPDDRAMSDADWREALELEEMQRAAAALDAPAPVPRRLRIVRTAPY